MYEVKAVPPGGNISALMAVGCAFIHDMEERGGTRDSALHIFYGYVSWDPEKSRMKCLK